MNKKYNVVVYCEYISSNIDYFKSIQNNYNLCLQGVVIVNSTGSHVHQKLIDCLNTNKFAIEDNDYDEDDCKEINYELQTYKKLNLSTPFFNTNDITLDNCQIIIILSNSDTHYELLRSFIADNINLTKKVIIFKNNLTNSFYEMSSIYKTINYYLDKPDKIKILTHYKKRFLFEYKHIRDRLFNDCYGKIYSCTVKYTEGLINNGSSLIDFFNWCFGNFINGRILGNYSSCYEDYNNRDLTYPIHLVYDKCANVFMIPIDSLDYYGMSEMEIITEYGKIVINDNTNKMHFYANTDDCVLSENITDYQNLNLEDSVDNLLDSVVYGLNNNGYDLGLGTTLQDNMDVWSILNYLLNKHRNS